MCTLRQDTAPSTVQSERWTLGMPLQTIEVITFSVMLPISIEVVADDGRTCSISLR